MSTATSASIGRPHWLISQQTFTVQFDVEPRHVRFELSATDADNVDKSYEVCHDDNTQNSSSLSRLQGRFVWTICVCGGQYIQLHKTIS